MTKQRLLRFSLAISTFLVLGGPSPGAVGSCNDDIPIADPVEFCIAKKKYTCVRDNYREELTTSYEECIANADSSCAGATWDNCDPPNEIKADACIQALRSMSRIDEPTSAILECNAQILCPEFAPATAALTAEVSQ